MLRYLPVVIALTLAAGLPATARAQAPADPTPFQCCDNATITQIVRQYIRLVDAVIDEPDTRITAFAHAFIPYLRAHSSLPAEEKAVISDLHRKLTQAKDSAAHVREALPEIGRGIIFLALRHEGGSETVVEAWCPGRGAWLQRRTEEPRSPFGERCGQWR